ncbi:MAG: hypothetical protein M1814_000046 [Vezdaea aestivalis]|nr:MAG: hypothetical protein M1814_000046 [Vezdaea aestivalis]
MAPNQGRSNTRFLPTSRSSPSAIHHSVASSTGSHRGTFLESSPSGPRRPCPKTRFVSRQSSKSPELSLTSGSDLDLTINSRSSSTRFILRKGSGQEVKGDSSIIINPKAFGYSHTDSSSDGENETASTQKSWLVRPRPMNPMLNRSRSPNSIDFSAHSSNLPHATDSTNASRIPSSNCPNPTGYSIKNQRAELDGNSNTSNLSRKIAKPLASESYAQSTISSHRSGSTVLKKKSLWDQTFISASFADVDANAPLKGPPEIPFPRIELEGGASNLDFDPTVNTSNLSELFRHLELQVEVEKPIPAQSEHKPTIAPLPPSPPVDPTRSSVLAVSVVSTPYTLDDSGDISPSQQPIRRVASITEPLDDDYSSSFAPSTRQTFGDGVDSEPSVPPSSHGDELPASPSFKQSIGSCAKEDEDEDDDGIEDKDEDEDRDSVGESHPTEEIVILESLRMLQEKCARLEEENSAAKAYIESLHVLLRSKSPEL